MAAPARSIPLAHPAPATARGRYVSRGVFFVAALVITALSLLPFLLTVSGSFKTPSEILDWPPSLLPTNPQWSNYVEVLTNSRYFPRWMLNSVALSAGYLLAYLAVTSLAGYAFARLRFPGAGIILLGLIGSMMVPGQVLWVPQFLIIKQVGLIDNLLGILFPDLAGVVGVFFMTQFFKSLPRELEEAASIDGAGRLRTFWSVILPNALPGIGALAILRFQGSWNAFSWPLIVVRSPENMTLPLGLASFQGLYGVHWQWVLAGAMFNAIPVILLVIFFQRYFVRGLTSGAVKG